MSWRRFLLLALAALFTSLLAVPVVFAAPKKGAKSAAAASKKRVAVLPFEGPGAADVRKSAVKELEQNADVDVIDEKKTKGFGRPEGAGAYVNVARKVDASAVLRGEISKKGNKYKLTIIVYNGADGQILDQVEFEGTKVAGLKKSLEETLATRMADSVSSARTPEPERAEPAKAATKPAPEAAKPETKPEAEAKPEAEPATPAAPEEKEEPEEPAEAAAEPATAGGQMSALEVGLALEGYSRNLDYNDDLFQALRGYELGAAPAIVLSGRFYPGALFAKGPVANIGISGELEYGFLTSTTNVDEKELETKTGSFMVGVRYRIPLQRHELGASLSYGQHSFTTEGDPIRPFPDVKYGFIRPAFDGRFRVGSIVFGFQGGYRLLTGTGNFEEGLWFPHVTGAGIDAGVFVGQAMSKQLDLTGGFQIRRYFFDMNAVRGDVYAVGGAVDQYLSLWLGVSFRTAGEPR